MAPTTTPARSLREAKGPKKKIPNKPGKSNWVEAAGGLPSYIRRIAEHLHGQGHSVSSAIAMAVSTVKRWAAGGGGVKPDTKAKAAAAVASWEAKKGKTKVGKARKALTEELRATPEEEAAIARDTLARLNLCEGMLLSLGTGRDAAVKNTKALLESSGGRVSIGLTIGGSEADPSELAETRAALEEEIDLLVGLLGGLAPHLEEAQRAPAGVGKPPANGADPSKPKASDDESVERTRSLQRRLASIGHEVLDDGIFGPKTDAAVKQFQSHSGIKEDGVVGPTTTDYLKMAPPPEVMAAAEEEDAHPTPVGSAPGAAASQSPASPVAGSPPGAAAPDAEGSAKLTSLPPVLYKGMGVGTGASPAVEQVQSKLGKTGMAITSDGIFGPETEKVTKRFQKKWGLKSDGLVGPKTQMALDVASKKVSELREAVEAREAAAKAGDSAAFGRARSRERVLRRTLEEAETRTEGEKHHKLKCPKCGTVQSARGDCSKCGHKLDKARKAKFAKLSEADWKVLAEATNAGMLALIAKIVAAGIPEEQAKALAAKLVSQGKVKLPTAKRGGDRRAEVELKRLPNGNFAPKGQGQILKAGQAVDVPHKSGKGFVAGVTKEDGEVALVDGPDAGQSVKAKKEGIASSAEDWDEGRAEALAKGEVPGQGGPESTAASFKPGDRVVDTKSGKLLTIKAGAAKKDDGSQTPITAEDVNGNVVYLGQDQAVSPAPPKVDPKTGAGAAKPKPEAKVGPQEIDGPQYAAMLSKHEKESKAEKAAAKKPKGSKTGLAADKEQADKVGKAGKAAGAPKSKLAAAEKKGKKPYGNLGPFVVLQNDGKGNWSPIEGAKTIEAARKKKKLYPGQTMVADNSPGAEPETDTWDGKAEYAKKGATTASDAPNPLEPKWKLPLPPQSPGTGDEPPPMQSPGTAAYESGPQPMQTNTGNLSLKDMPFGTHVMLADGERFVLHKAVNDPWLIMKPVDEQGNVIGKAKPIHKMLAPPQHGPIEAPGVAPDLGNEAEANMVKQEMADADAAGGGDDLFAKLAASVDAAAKKKTAAKPVAPFATGKDKPKVESYDPKTGPNEEQKTAAAKAMGKTYEPKNKKAATAGDSSAAFTDATKPGKAGGQGPGRGPTGKLRNFKAMGKTKLAGVISELEQLGNDPEALSAAKAAAAAKGFSVSGSAPAKSKPKAEKKGRTKEEASALAANFKAMGKSSLAGTISELEQSDDDPEALSLAKEAAAAKAKPKPKPTAKKVVMDNPPPGGWTEADKVPKDKQKAPSMAKPKAGSGSAFPVASEDETLTGEHGSVPLKALSEDEIDFELDKAHKAAEAFETTLKDSMLYSKTLHDRAKKMIKQLEAEKAKRADNISATNAALDAYKAAGGNDSEIIALLQKQK